MSTTKEPIPEVTIALPAGTLMYLVRDPVSSQLIDCELTAAKAVESAHAHGKACYIERTTAAGGLGAPPRGLKVYEISESGEVVLCAAALEQYRHVRAAPRECAVCGAQAPWHCARCRAAFYCSKACQKKDWPAHKENCKALPR
jgi:hypothetical protein